MVQSHHLPASSDKLAELILTIPYNSVHIPAALSDYNNGATLIAQGWCVHIFPSNLQIGEAVVAPLCR
ncbi:MAG TPA: hypothetical protein VGN04_08940, partial [Herbaspirillum sp.]